MTDLEKAAKDALRELLDLPPLNALAVLFGALAPDLDRAATTALQDDIVRLYKLIQDGLSALSDEVRGKINPEEAMEGAIQVVTHLGRTANRDKRALMITICVHGILRPDDDAAEKRLFGRAMEDLDMSHIAMLRRADESSFHDTLIVKDIQRAIISELMSLGFMQRTEKKTTIYRTENEDPEREERWALYSLTPLGRRFVDSMRGTLGTHREPQPYILENPDPLP